jgi:hypothetical protein
VPRQLSDRGAGLLSTVAGVVVFLSFLLFAVQLLFGLYAASAVNAVANDAATRAASSDHPAVGVIEAEARHSLGEIGASADFTWSREDSDGDGIHDTVVLEVVARPPRFVPPSLGGAIGIDDIRRTIRVREEQTR